MAVSTQRARRAEFDRYKQDVKREGKPFFPYAMLHDTIMSLVVVLVIIGLACVWYFAAGDTEEGNPRPLLCGEGRSGHVRVRAETRLVLLLPLLPAAHLQVAGDGVLGTVGIPTILLILLLGLPFYDRSRERRPLRRPVAMVTAIIVVLSMGVLTWKGATAEEALGSELIAQGLPEQWASEQGFEGNTAAEAGATLFAQTGCLGCHTYVGTGAGNLGAPDLTDVGLSGRGSRASSRTSRTPPSSTTP